MGHLDIIDSTCSVQSHYRDQNLTCPSQNRRNAFQSIIQNQNIFIEGNAFGKSSVKWSPFCSELNVLLIEINTAHLLHFKNKSKMNAYDNIFWPIFY